MLPNQFINRVFRDALYFKNLFPNFRCLRVSVIFVGKFTIFSIIGKGKQVMVTLALKKINYTEYN